MKKINLDKKQIKEIISAYQNDGIGMKSIGEKYGVSREVIKRVLTENDVELDKPGQKFKGGKSEADKRYREKVSKNGVARERHEKWLSQNRDRVKLKQNEWRKNNADKLNKYKREYQRRMISTNPQYKLAQRFRTALWQNIKDNRLSKYKKTFDMLPYTFDELKEHLEKNFQEGMTWENYGEWHIDHVIPQSNFSYTTTDSDEFKICWSLNNLKPMWGKVNLSKNSTLSHLTLPMVRELKNLDINVKVDYKTVLISKEYLKSVLDTMGKKYIESYLDDVVDLIVKISPELPKIKTDENITKMMGYLNSVDPMDENGNIVNARVNSYGNMFLKSRFESYWYSSYKNNKSPIDFWKNKKNIKLILKYRTGINNSGEVFDISLHQLIKGISATRKSISFFKPLLAAHIYIKYLGDQQKPTVFDPCAGFGGRLLGFKLAYPQGTYIACEPNPQTYQELINLVNELSLTNVIIHNCKFEDLTINFDYDFAFTSIPYFDTEIYSNQPYYTDINSWCDIFLKPILNLKRCIINLSEFVYNECMLDEKVLCYLINGKTHFNRIENKEFFIQTKKSNYL